MIAHCKRFEQSTQEQKAHSEKYHRDVNWRHWKFEREILFRHIPTCSTSTFI
jgi:hypothetical protein